MVEVKALAKTFRELSVGELAARSGVAVSALHFYERKGMIRSRRTAGNQRRYSGSMLRIVGMIHFGQSLGIPLKEIAEALGRLPKDRAPSAAEWRTVSREWGKRLDARIAALHSLREALTDCIGCGCLSTEKCPLRNPEDRLAKRGAGPRRLMGDV
jgi:MerR family redox-sensitive transcriptional activator SoxR